MLQHVPSTTDACLPFPPFPSLLRPPNHCPSTTTSPHKTAICSFPASLTRPFSFRSFMSPPQNTASSQSLCPVRPCLLHISWLLFFISVFVPLLFSCRIGVVHRALFGIFQRLLSFLCQTIRHQTQTSPSPSSPLLPPVSHPSVVIHHEGRGKPVLPLAAEIRLPSPSRSCYHRPRCRPISSR